ncbi:MAG: metallophosphoesterase family protein [Candidatus Woesearchaeota archaeon]
MKLFVFSDNHGKLDIINKIKKSDAEIFICLGDFTLFGSNQKNFLIKLNSLNKKILLIHGNHESWSEVKEDVKGLKNIIFLNKSIYKYKGIIFAGYGGGGFAYKERSFNILENKIKKELKNEKIILLTHAPPFGTKLDLIDNMHIGCITYTNFIKKYKPIYAFSGHVHENEGVKDFKFGAILINPGHKGMEIIL